MSTVKPVDHFKKFAAEMRADPQLGAFADMELVTYWISFESAATREWLGVIIVDSEDIALDDEESRDAFITGLVQQGLCPSSGDVWNVRIQKLPAGTEIPQQHMNRLIVDSSVTAALGGVMISHHGAN